MPIHHIIHMAIGPNIFPISGNYMPLAFHIQFNNLGYRITASIQPRTINPCRVHNGNIQPALCIAEYQFLCHCLGFFVGIEKSRDAGIFLGHGLVP